MARPTLYTHRKFLRLIRLIGGSRAIALGSLELIWHRAYQEGDPLVGQDEIDVEDAADWQGEGGRLCAALVTSGFLERTERGYEVHDLMDHAPAYVRRRMEAEQRRRDSGATISEARRSAAKKSWEQRAKTTNGEPFASKTAPRHANGAQNMQTDATPAPAPAPSPIPEVVPPRDLARRVLGHAPSRRSGDSTPNDDAPAVIEFPATRGQTYRVTAADVAAWDPAYPAVDVVPELRRALEWIRANPTKRKTLRGYPKFVTSWLGRAQDRGGSGRTATGLSPAGEKTAESARIWLGRHKP